MKLPIEKNCYLIRIIKLLITFIKKLKAVNLVNSVGISHNDLRDKNIIIENDLNIKIIDFGLSRTSNNVDSSYLQPLILPNELSKNGEKYNLRNDKEALEYLVLKIKNYIENF